MTITIHIGSMFFGVAIGFVLVATVYWLLCAKGNEFSEGWTCGSKYAQDREKEKLNKVKEQMLKYGFKAPDMTVDEFIDEINK